MNKDDIIGVLKEADALLSGHFELRSGLHSNQFFQCAKIFQRPDVAERLCAALVEKMRAELGDDIKAESVIAPALGGIVVGHEVARAMGVRSIFAEKDGDDLVLRRGFKIGDGEKFVVAEDVVTRGGRVQQTIDLIREHGGEVVAACVLVNRSGGTASFGVPLVSLLEMEPVTYEPEHCPMCKDGSVAEHPGS